MSTVLATSRAVAQPCRCRRCRSGSLTSRLPLLPRLSRLRWAAWLLQIGRNACYSWLEKNRARELMVEFDEELYPQTVATHESIAIADEGRERLSRALGRSETLCIDCVSPISGGCTDG